MQRMLEIPFRVLAWSLVVLVLVESAPVRLDNIESPSSESQYWEPVPSCHDCSLPHLPNHVQLAILQYLDLRSQLQLGTVCQQTHQLVHDHHRQAILKYARHCHARHPKTTWYRVAVKMISRRVQEAPCSPTMPCVHSTATTSTGLPVSAGQFRWVVEQLLNDDNDCRKMQLGRLAVLCKLQGWEVGVHVVQRTGRLDPAVLRLLSDRNALRHAHCAYARKFLRADAQLNTRDAICNNLFMDVRMGRMQLSVFHLALGTAGRHQSEVVEWLLEEGASVEEQDANGMTSLLTAILHCRKEDTKVVELLLAAGADANQEACGTTPLCLAIQLGRADVMQVLLELGNADPTCRNREGRTPLELAEETGFPEVVHILQAHLEQTDVSQCTTPRSIDRGSSVA